MNDDLKTEWQQATGDLPWGIQRAFYDVLALASEEKVNLVYGADYFGTGACLVNQAGSMLQTGGGRGIPAGNFPEVVGLFDKINRVLREKEINTEERKVSPLAAEILMQWFAPFRPHPDETPEEAMDVNNTMLGIFELHENNN